MAIDFIKAKDKLAEHGAIAATKVKEAGGKAAVAAADNAKFVTGKAQEKITESRKNKYNPVFPEEYLDPNFDRPKMIVIKDEDGRKGIDVCEGAIGWLGKNDDLEILFLYEEAVPFSGLIFHPRPVCDAAYYLDNVFEGGRFVSLNCFFEEIQKDKMTELRNIAFKLGAKSCTVETIEYSKQVEKKKSVLEQKLKVKIPGKPSVSSSASSKAELETSSEASRHIEFSQTFAGHNNPERPELHWYAHDKEILSLIEMRCNGTNPTNEYNIMIDCASTEAMSSTMAKKIDAALGKVGTTTSSSLERNATKESHRKLRYNIIF